MMANIESDETMQMLNFLNQNVDDLVSTSADLGNNTILGSAESSDAMQVSNCLNQDVTDVDSPQADAKKVDDNNITPIKPFKCAYCEKSFLSNRSRSRHLREKHCIGISQSITECLECLLDFRTKDELRQHLQDHHDLDMAPICLYFPKLEEFLTWKSNMERETLTVYYHSRQTKTEPPTITYRCGRSGKRRYDKKTYRCMRLGESAKSGIACTAEIHAQLFGNEVIVKHYPVHYGHGKNAVIELSSEEKSAVDELEEQGLDPGKLLEELTSKEWTDLTQMYYVRKRCLKWVRCAYKIEDFDRGLSDLELVSEWVRKCSSMEECPVLFCQQENIATESEKFILVIMTEFQRQIIMSASKQVICVDAIVRISDVHLITLLVIDELMTAFPVAYCLSNKLDKSVMKQFFSCIKEYAGNFSPEYLMTNHNPYFFEAWVEVMDNSPQWLWNRWDTEGSIIDHLRLFVKKNPQKRRELYDIFQIILDCKSKDVAIHLFKNCIDKIEQDENINKLGEWAMKRLGSDMEKWAMSFQKEINNSILHLEVMHNVYFTCCSLGKGKTLYTLLSVLMKILKYKILDRILNSFDDEKINLAVAAIDFFHAKGLTFPSEKISSVSNNLWMVQLDELNKVFVTQDMDNCPDHCSLRCKKCEICVHQFSCSCVNSMIDANLCLHIHAVVHKFHPIKIQYTPLDKLFNLEASNSNRENHSLSSTLHTPFVTTVKPATDSSPLQESCVSNETVLSEADPVQSDACHSSQVFISTSPQADIPKLFSTKISNEHLSSFFSENKPKHLVQNSRSILKRKPERVSEETAVKKTNKLPKLNDKNTCKKKVLKKTTQQPPLNNESTNMSPEVILENTVDQVIQEGGNVKIKSYLKKSEMKDMAFKKTTTLFQLLKHPAVSKESLIAINKRLNECISLASNNINTTVQMPRTVPIKAVYVIQPQKPLSEVLLSLKKPGSQ